MASVADGKASEGMDLYKKRVFDQASQKFLEASNGKPNDPKISYNLGNSRYREEKFEDALQNYSKSLSQKSHAALKQKSVYNMGNTLFRMKKFSESIDAYKKALTLDPNDMDAKFNLEFAREQIKKQKEQQQKGTTTDNKKDQKTSAQKQKNSNQDNDNESLKSKEIPPGTKQKNNDLKQNTFSANEVPLKKMTKEQAENRLQTLNEDLKRFQRKQALNMESLFNYQGNDW